MPTDNKGLTPEQIIDRLSTTLQDRNSHVEKQLSSLESKLDQLSRDVFTMQTDIRKELQAQFVRVEVYEPRHKTLELKMEQYDRHISASEQESRDFAVTKVEIKQLQDDLIALEDAQKGLWSRVTPWIAVLLTFLGLLFTILQHTQFK